MITSNRADAPLPFPWDEAFAFVVGILRLSPDHFWKMTPRELSAILSFKGKVALPSQVPSHRVLADLIARYPDSTDVKGLSNP